ncbi:ribosomal RNA small subunit methyltransferase, chloroplastic isoform X2 [Euphorbia lathyris]|uniref:ribosomal RNA small subunit methyltransferase, chloroplastic isoform X2 n=1 Tax=Euphorbia lathyris TaxID=212925 RepID=UPI003313A811
MSLAPHLLPISPPGSGRAKPSSPAHNSIAALQRRTLTICCNTKTSSDDYYATLKALNSRGRRPRKGLGQHYMLNSQVNQQLVDAANVQEGDVVLEIGPGTGSLTNVLLDTGATVLAIEKVVANIPFNISTDVVKELLPMGDIFSEVVLLLQDETALRLVESSIRTSEYRLINVFVNFYSDPEYKFRVPRSNFFPQPNVDAAVVTFKLKPAIDYPPVSSAKSFFSMVNSAFNGKRKMLRKSLQHINSSSEIEEALRNAGLPATSRPEELTLDDFVKLHNLIMRE